MWAGVTLVSLGVLAGGMVVASRWYAFTYASGGVLTVQHGIISWFKPGWTVLNPVPRPQWNGQLSSPYGFEWLLQDYRDILIIPEKRGFQWFRLGGVLSDAATPSVVYEVVGWPIPLFFLIAGILPLRSGWRVRRRIRSGGCTGCGYDLSATPAPAPCPECGAQRLENETRRSMMNAPRTS